MENTTPIRDTGVPPVFRFPTSLAIATILTTGLALAAAALNLQWGAAAPAPDALENAWLYVNLALLWTTLALWPSLALVHNSSRITLLCDFAAIFLAALPALSLSAFISNIPLAAITSTLALQLALALFALSLLAWRARIPPTLIAASLATLALLLPLFAYLWAEFLPAAPQSWFPLIPMLALHHAATALPTSFLWWTIALYAFLAISLLATAPRAAHR